MKLDLLEGNVIFVSLCIFTFLKCVYVLLPTYISGYHWCLWKLGDDIGSCGTGDADGYELLCGC